ncbi:MAG: hypothetical protein ACE5LB_04365 [Acidiferrobacterales bacterium]
MTKNPDFCALLRKYLDDPEASWSIGSFGAIAEYRWVGGEMPVVKNLDSLTVASERGALQIRLPEGVQPLAYENVSSFRERWLHGMFFCLRNDLAAMSQRCTLTEIGPDKNAVLPEHRAHILFDLSLGIPHVDTYVRSGDPAFVAQLREYCGRSILVSGNPAMAAIKAHSPHRVFVSQLGRVEVYQHIGSTARNIPTPIGPHTHVSPKFLNSGRTHPATIPVPEQMLPCLSLYPPNPLMSIEGEDKPFDRAQLDDFARLLSRWGNRDFVSEKNRAACGLDACVEPGDYVAPPTRLGRLALRVTLRQRACVDNAGDLIERWRLRFDPTHDNPGLMAH